MLCTRGVAGEELSATAARAALGMRSRRDGSSRRVVGPHGCGRSALGPVLSPSPASAARRTTSRHGLAVAAAADAAGAAQPQHRVRRGVARPAATRLVLGGSGGWLLTSQGRIKTPGNSLRCNRLLRRSSATGDAGPVDPSPESSEPKVASTPAVAANSQAEADEPPTPLEQRPSRAAAAAEDAGEKEGGNPLAKAVAALWAAFVGLFAVLGFTGAKGRRLKALRAEAEAAPEDADKEARYLEALGESAPLEVVKRCEGGTHPSNTDCVVAYLRALVESGNLEKYKTAAAATHNQEALTTLLTSLQQRAQGGKEALKAGETSRLPLYVTMIEPKVGNQPLRWLQSLVGTVLSICTFSFIFLVLSSAMHKYTRSAGVPAGMGNTASAAPGTSGSGSGSYAPKQFSKEDMPEKSIKTFADVKGCDEAKAELQEIVQYLKDPAKFTRLGGKLPKGVLLAGPPGTGKTLLARAVAGEADVPFFYRAGSEFEEMFVGVGSRRVRSLFAAAKKKTPCIVFIDEIDAIGASRKSWESHTRKTLNQLLVEMDGFENNEGVIVLAATNLPETLDAALTRPGRFDRHITVSNPDVKGRQQIIEHYLEDKPVDASVDANLLARSTPGFSGADLFNLVNFAAIQAAINDADSINNRLLDAAKDRILMGSERTSAVMSEENRKLTAYHEAGHAVVAINTAGAHPIHKATIMPRGNALGMVMQVPSTDETSVSRRQMLAKLDVCMGGRVAEELIFGPDQVTSGATSDLKQATSLARYMVMNCGMSDLVGPIYLEDNANGKGGGNMSADTEKNVDAEVMRLLKEAYGRVTVLLKSKEADLHAVSQALLDRETLTSQEIHAVLLPKEDAPAAPKQPAEPLHSLEPGPAADEAALAPDPVLAATTTPSADDADGPAAGESLTVE